MKCGFSDKKDFFVKQKELLVGLNKILREGEYISHLGSLFFGGYIDYAPKRISVLSTRRRRKRIIAGYDVVFQSSNTCNKADRVKITSEKYSILIASPETSFVDMLADLNYAPDLPTLAHFAASLPISASRVLELAASASDSVLKRASYLLALCGRITYSRIPFSQFSISPSYLDSRISGNGDSCWDKRFRLFVPESILSWKIPSNSKNRSSAWEKWLYKMNSSGVKEFQRKTGLIFLREDPFSEKVLDNIVFSFSNLSGHFNKHSVRLDKSSPYDRKCVRIEGKHIENERIASEQIMRERFENRRIMGERVTCPLDKDKQDFPEIDFGVGAIRFGGNSVKTNTNSLPVKALSFLSEAFPETVPVSVLLKKVWGENFDNKSDLHKVKTTINRLRKLLKQVCPASEIMLHNSANITPFLQLHLPSQGVTRS
ncbi:MAG: winged helix-turn-helix domain-containing protein [Candidatus Riflebacteria bacterium]|nr:winged helix-turn-helix domain-containing protein [Candidatus Riflebacteria bacterium]